MLRQQAQAQAAQRQRNRRRNAEAYGLQGATEFSADPTLVVNSDRHERSAAPEDPDAPPDNRLLKLSDDDARQLGLSDCPRLLSGPALEEEGMGRRVPLGGRDSGGRIRTCDLRVMSPTSYQTAPPRGGQ